MLKALAHTNTGRPIIILGLEQANLDRLPQEPIVIDTTNQPPDGFGDPDGLTIVLYAGDNHDELVDTLAALSGDLTNLDADPT